MQQRAPLIACCILLFIPSMLAQSGKTAGDPLSGTWTGYMERDGGGERRYITLSLKADGKNITGTITGPPSPGEIRTGTFDPATGALKLEIVVQDDAKTVAIFEGQVAQGSASGTVSINNAKGTFKLTREGAAKPASGASAAAGDPAMAAIQRSFAEVSDYVTKAAALVPQDKYTYRPTESVRTFGQMVAHIADGYDYYCATAAGRRVEWSDATEKGSTDKATIAGKLKQATETCRAAHAGGAQVGPLVSNIAHANLHYGNLVTYMRMLGLVPPSS